MEKPIRIYKNSLMFDNVLMIAIDDKVVDRTECNNRIVTLYHEDTLVGINVFDASLFDQFKEGFNYPTQENLSKLNNYFKDFQFSYDKDSYLRVGTVVSWEPIQNSDKLKLCQVKVDDTMFSIVCGADNVEENMKTIVALDNAILPDGTLIQSGKVLKTHSDGMLCSKKELSLEQRPEEKGIIKLDDDEGTSLSFFDIDWRNYSV